MANTSRPAGCLISREPRLAHPASPRLRCDPRAGRGVDKSASVPVANILQGTSATANRLIRLGSAGFAQFLISAMACLVLVEAGFTPISMQLAILAGCKRRRLSVARYCIVAAKPKGTTNHLKSQFRVLQEDPKDGEWVGIGWKSIFDVCAFLENGDAVFTGRISGKNIDIGDHVELELRISNNRTKYPISSMPNI